MIPVKMGQQDQPDPRGVHAETLHADKGGRSTIQQKAKVSGLHTDTGLKPSPAPESVSRSEKLNFDFFHYKKSPLIVQEELKKVGKTPKGGRGGGFA
jgi:hypothetical protein